MRTRCFPELAQYPHSRPHAVLACFLGRARHHQLDILLLVISHVKQSKIEKTHSFPFLPLTVDLQYISYFITCIVQVHYGIILAGPFRTLSPPSPWCPCVRLTLTRVGVVLHTMVPPDYLFAGSVQMPRQNRVSPNYTCNIIYIYIYIHIYINNDRSDGPDPSANGRCTRQEGKKGDV